MKKIRLPVRSLIVIVSLFATCCFFHVSPAFANKTGPVLRILTCEEPPTNYLDRDGRVTGITTDIVRELRRRTGAVGKIKLLPWPRAYKIALYNPNVVLFTAGRTAEREKLFHWVGPLFLKRWVVLARRGANLKFSKLDDLRAVKHIVVLKNDARAQLLRKKGFTNLLEVGSHAQAVKMLAAGRAELWPTSDMEGAVIARQAGVDFADLEMVFVLKIISPSIIISRRTPKRIVAAWQTAFQNMVDDGTLARIAKDWSKKLQRSIVVRNRVLVYGSDSGAE